MLAGFGGSKNAEAGEDIDEAAAAGAERAVDRRNHGRWGDDERLHGGGLVAAAAADGFGGGLGDFCGRFGDHSRRTGGGGCFRLVLLLVLL